tara:strand:+ start:441 stop:1214 length:774 start_codon:yes stop_codon:yes gene_type:complete
MFIPNFIPKKIFQTYSSFDEIDPLMKENIKKIQQEHKDWEYHFYSHKDVESFILKFYGKKYLNSYLQIDPDYGPARADLFRYLLLFKFGGVYLDTKTGLNKNLNEIIKVNDRYIISHWGKSHPEWGIYPELGEEGEYQQWFIICEPLHPFLGLTIANVIDNIKSYSAERFGVGKLGVLRTTGPIPYTFSILKLIDLYHHRQIDSESAGLQYSIFDEKEKKMEHVWHFKKKHYIFLTKPVIRYEESDEIKNKKNISYY